MYDDESDSDKPDENQIELVKKLHREMADRRIIVNMKNKIKNKKECVNLKPNKPKSVEIAWVAQQKSAQTVPNWSESDDRKGKRASTTAKFIAEGLGRSWTHSRPLKPP